MLMVGTESHALFKSIVLLLRMNVLLSDSSLQESKIDTQTLLRNSTNLANTKVHVNGFCPVSTCMQLSLLLS